ncbi:MAG TPA: glycosyltransferase family 4 protein [Pyrinomonadaceae bacterium]|nr:glycosyltransferase family 4 protein [Pyrinomonadaceae bacterium]
MKILWVKAGKILPVDTGGKIRSYNLLRQLASRHETVLLSYYGGARDAEYEREVARHLPGAVTVHTGAPDSFARQALDYLFRLPSSAPYAVRKFTSPAVQKLVREWDAARRFDVAVCDFLSASLNFPAETRTPTVLFQHNVESALWQRQARHAPDVFRGVVFKIEAARMTRYERDAVRRFRHVIAVSENDRELMSAMTDASRITVVPTGVDIKKYSSGDGDARASGEGKSPDGALVVFLGSMDWEPNIDGVEYFCREVWPRVSASVPEARFRVVGRDPHPRVRRLASETVEVTGTVPSVVEHLREADVVVVPLRVGGGTRLKIFEAMATGKAVVSTTVGAEGLDVTHGEDILLADDAAGFAESVTGLLRDASRRESLGRAAAALAARYDWSVIARRFEDVLARAAGVEDAAGEAERVAETVGV